MDIQVSILKLFWYFISHLFDLKCSSFYGCFLNKVAIQAAVAVLIQVVTTEAEIVELVPVAVLAVLVAVLEVLVAVLEVVLAVVLVAVLAVALVVLELVEPEEAVITSKIHFNIVH